MKTQNPLQMISDDFDLRYLHNATKSVIILQSFGKRKNNTVGNQKLVFRCVIMTFAVNFSIFLRLSGRLQTFPAFCTAEADFMPRLQRETSRNQKEDLRISGPFLFKDEWITPILVPNVKWFCCRSTYACINVCCDTAVATFSLLLKRSDGNRTDGKCELTAENSPGSKFLKALIVNMITCSENSY